MTFILNELEWFDFEGWRRHLAEVEALPPSDSRDRQITTIKLHLAEIELFEKTPEKSPVSGPAA